MISIEKTTTVLVGDTPYPVDCLTPEAVSIVTLIDEFRQQEADEQRSLLKTQLALRSLQRDLLSMITTQLGSAT